MLSNPTAIPEPSGLRSGTDLSFMCMLDRGFAHAKLRLRRKAPALALRNKAELAVLLRSILLVRYLERSLHWFFWTTKRRVHSVDLETPMITQDRTRKLLANKANTLASAIHSSKQQLDRAHRDTPVKQLCACFTAASKDSEGMARAALNRMRTYFRCHCEAELSRMAKGRLSKPTI